MTTKRSREVPARLGQIAESMRKIARDPADEISDEVDRTIGAKIGRLATEANDYKEKLDRLLAEHQEAYDAYQDKPYPRLDQAQRQAYQAYMNHIEHNRPPMHRFEDYEREIGDAERAFQEKVAELRATLSRARTAVYPRSGSGGTR